MGKPQSILGNKKVNRSCCKLIRKRLFGGAFGNGKEGLFPGKTKNRCRKILSYLSANRFPSHTHFPYRRIMNLLPQWILERKFFFFSFSPRRQYQSNKLRLLRQNFFHIVYFIYEEQSQQF